MILWDLRNSAIHLLTTRQRKLYYWSALRRTLLPNPLQVADTSYPTKPLIPSPSTSHTSTDNDANHCLRDKIKTHRMRLLPQSFSQLSFRIKRDVLTTYSHLASSMDLSQAVEKLSCGQTCLIWGANVYFYIHPSNQIEYGADPRLNFLRHLH